MIIRKGASLPLLALVGALAVLTSSVLAAGDLMEWRFSESHDPENKGRMTARLTFGLPENGAIQVSGVCEAASAASAKFSSITLGADAGDLENGKQVDVRFSGGGFDHVLQGQIHRAAGGEVLSGVRLTIDNQDPLWRAMTEKASLDYLVPGYKASTLSFERGKDRIEQFVQACRTYAATLASPSNDQATPQTLDAGRDGAEEAFFNAKELGTIEAWEAFLASYPSGFHADLARAYVKTLEARAAAAEAPTARGDASFADSSCKQLSKNRSQNSNTPAKITFVNNSSMYRAILWLDFTGQPKDYAGLNSGQQVTLDTFLTHPWMVTDGPGNCIEIVMPSAARKVVELGGANAEPQPKPSQRTEIKAPGCEEGFKLVNGRCKRRTKRDGPGGCPPGTKPVPETDNCVAISAATKRQASSNRKTAKKASGCEEGYKLVYGRCKLRSKRDGPGGCPRGTRPVPETDNCVAIGGPKQRQVDKQQQAIRNLQKVIQGIKNIRKKCGTTQIWNGYQCEEND